MMLIDFILRHWIAIFLWLYVVALFLSVILAMYIFISDWRKGYCPKCKARFGAEEKEVLKVTDGYFSRTYLIKGTRLCPNCGYKAVEERTEDEQKGVDEY